ncbi:MAG: hypothetical protein Athens101428_779 [Candidatus Berkelbacteria bacterium Athens1014_28]|uniref:Metallo-beta-lactamase domain-containing protein n=1 Tax=Candidatus Berkelbacteria bacterium Athens1014_28 TaxID=2017145 RepID=A0A554LJ59_9BACT|nr:MAG: hypothetical protein Athens101428_779 [Candidatus Berkelbacteria bacterium Athens1014_28]
MIRNRGGQKILNNCETVTAPGGHMIMLDCGALFHDEDSIFSGSDNLFPNFDGINIDLLDAVFISHAHDDHMAAIVKLLQLRGYREGNPLVVYCSEITEIVIRNKIGYALNERENVDKMISPELAGNVEFRRLQPEQQIGDFKIYAFPVYHSIPGAYIFVVEIDGKRICYLTDFRFNLRDQIEWNRTFQTLTNIGSLGIDFLMIDVIGYPNRKEAPTLQAVAHEFGEIINLFAKNVEEHSQFAQVANEIGDRKVDVVGGPNSAINFFCREFGVIRKRLQQGFKENSKVSLISGCMAESSATLTLASYGKSDHLKFDKNTVVIIPTRIIPGTKSKVNQMIARLTELKDSEGNYQIFKIVVTEMEPKLLKHLNDKDQNFKEKCGDRVLVCPKLHCSGHATRPEIKLAIETIAPEEIAGIHANATTRHEFENRIPSWFGGKITVNTLDANDYVMI